jgi:hypothetical protein
MLTCVKALDVIHRNAGDIGDLLIGGAFFIFLVSHNREQGIAMGLEVIEDGAFLKFVHGTPHKFDRNVYDGRTVRISHQKKGKFRTKKVVFYSRRLAQHLLH